MKKNFMKATSLALVAMMMVPSFAFAAEPEAIAEDREVAVVMEANEEDEDRNPNVSGVQTTADNVNVRKGPATTYASLGTVKKGSSYTLVATVQDEKDSTKNWYKVNYGSGYGYIRTDMAKLVTIN